MDDVAAIVARLQRAQDAPGAEALFTEIVCRFADMAFGCAYGILRDPELAQDAAQEAFAVAWRHLADLRDPAAFAGWFRRIVSNQARRLLRAQAREVTGAEVAEAVSPALEDEAEARDLQIRVRAAVEALPAPMRPVVLLYYVGGHPVAAVAALLGLTVPTVKNRLHAARGHLRRGELAMLHQGLGPQQPSRNPRFTEGVQSRLLPYRTDTRFYEDRAAGLLSVARSGLPSALELFTRWHPRLTGVEPGQVRPATLGMEDARWVVARQHGFSTWAAFARHVEDLAAGRAGSAPFLEAFAAIEQGDVAALSRQLEQEPDLVRARGTNGNSLLNLAAGCQALACARLLLEHGAPPDLANDRGWTPLHQAGYGDQAELAALLLACGADPRRSAHGEGGTPLVQTLFWGHRTTADLLARHGIHPPNLRVAAGLGRMDMLLRFFTPGGHLRVRAGAQRAFYRPHTGFPEWRPSDDPKEVLDEAFVYACRNGRFEAMAFLLERGADIDADPYRGTGLVWAAAKGDAATISWLLAHGADPNRLGTFGGPGHGQGVTALHLAAQAGHREVIGALLKGGADPHLRDALFDSTPAGWAAHFGHSELAGLLDPTAKGTSSEREE